MSAIVIYPNDGSVSYTIGGTPPAGPLAIDFPYFFPDEIAVTKITGLGTAAVPAYDLLEAGVDYTLVGVPADDGFHSGSVTMITVVTNCTIRIDRTLRADKMHNFPETGAISIPGMNTQFSRLWSWIQDLSRRIHQSVADSLSAYLPIAGGTMDGHIVLPTGPGATNAVRKDYVDAADSTLQTAINAKANIASPTFTGTPRAPTPPTLDAPSTRIATTEYMRNILATRGQGEGVWAFKGQTAGDPGSGGFIIDPQTGANRIITMSKTDADSVGRYLLLLRPGDSVVLTSEFTPITAYARYDISGTVTDNASWVSFPAVMTSLAGFTENPALNTRYRLSGYLNTAAGIDPIVNIVAGTGLDGGGSTGTVTLSVEPTLVPTGVVQDYAGATIPSGWLACQGQAVSRTTYAALYTALGGLASPWGQGNGTSTFNVPDLGGTVTAGREATATRLTVAGSGINGSLLGSRGGEQTTGLGEGHLPAHSHNLMNTNPSTLFASFNNGDTFLTYAGSGGIALYYQAVTNNVGSNLPHQNTQPTIVMHKIIKT